jgi:hypothetical protein
MHSQNNNPTLHKGPYPPPTLDIPAVSVRPSMPAPLNMSNPLRSATTTPLGDQYRSPQSYPSPASAATYTPLSNLNRSNSDGQYYAESNVGYDSSSTARNVAVTNLNNNQRHASFGSTNSVQYRPSSTSPQAMRSSGPSISSPTHFRMAPTSYAPSHNLPTQLQKLNGAAAGYIPQQQLPPMVTLPPPVFNTMAHAQPTYDPFNNPNTHFETPKDLDEEMRNASDSPVGDGSVPIFGVEGYAPSPFQMADDFAAWLGLIGDPQSYSSISAPLGPQRGSMSNEGQSFMNTHVNGTSTGQSLPTLPPQHPMAVTSILDSSLETILSEEKRQEILAIIFTRFNETSHAPVRKLKEGILEGNMDDENHVLSLRSMQTYIGSYWYHFHPQMPILHKPTFSADRAQNLLLIAVIAIGASCLDRINGREVTQAGSELSSFLAWHLRGEIFTDADFRPPAKLWIFQALLLLEVYEKMYSTRVLHERAHIHHATTLTLMRRGRTLRGRSALDSPPSLKDDKSSKSSVGSSSAIADTPDQWWNHWITNEATRRVAFAAFIIDSTHATMFGHSATMVAHEMRLPLPCDETLWSATSGLEVSRIEADLQSNGIKPTLFLDGLKWTLNGEPVRTNSFGRTALMAGLLSVSWHMNQRDMQVRSLGVIGGKDLWRSTLTKAFDKWERDFDSSASKDIKGYYYPGQPGKLDEENIFESRTVLHHLAHMAMHVDIVQCQIFAKATRLLGRTITPPDYNSARRNICDIWAPKATARDATFYALNFLSQVLAPDLHGSSRVSSNIIGMGSYGEYTPRDDFLLNRPWVLYFAALIVWSYGYALDGPIRNPPLLHTVEQQRSDMREFLRRAGEARAPQDLETLKDRNRCMGLLMILRDGFKHCRWEVSPSFALTFPGFQLTGRVTAYA